VARRRPQKMPRSGHVDVGSLRRDPRARFSLEGIPTSTFSLGLEYVLGCLESVARALAMHGRSPSRP
jgi:hypothetical protein